MTSKQTNTALAMLAGALTTAAVLLLPDRWFMPPLPIALAERVTIALRADAVTALWLLAAIANVARSRFFSAQDIDGSGLTRTSPQIAVDAAIIQNTLEQCVLAVILYPALASLPDQTAIAMVPKLAALFCLGRLSFWLGYRRGAPARAFGFATTFYPTVFGYAALLAGWGGF